MRKCITLGFLMLTFVGASHAQSAYGGIGTGGVTLGYSLPVAPNVTVRADWTGGVNMSEDRDREGVSYHEKLKMNRVGAFADYFPNDTGLHLTGGVTLNDTSLKLNSRAGSALIGNARVDMSNAYFNVELKQPVVTPYLGIGYSERLVSSKGWGWYADAGVQLGKFKAKTSTNVVTAGKASQADVDAETSSVAKGSNTLTAWAIFQIGATYRF